MRTISETVSTREKADLVRRRLEALGIGSENIIFQEVGEGGASSIFVTVKAAPEQVEAAANILKVAGAQERKPAPEPIRGEPGVVAAAPAPSRPAESDRGTIGSHAEPAPRIVSRDHRAEAEARAVPARDRQPGSVRIARMAAIAALLAGLGFAAGAALGILV